MRSIFLIDRVDAPAYEASDPNDGRGRLSNSQGVPMTREIAATQEARRGAFSSRLVFIFAAIGSAVGLGNIWRFPYVAYDNGGGAFILPYLVALLTAGIPFLYLDYAIGHRWRGSAPLPWRRFRRWAEFIGWGQLLICVVIARYSGVVRPWPANH